MAYIIEAAGGASICGKHRMLDVEPKELHQRVAVALGSRNEIDRLRKSYEG